MKTLTTATKDVEVRGKIMASKKKWVERLNEVLAEIEKGATGRRGAGKGDKTKEMAKVLGERFKA